MARSTDAENGVPSGGDREAFRHFGDGFAGELTASRIQGYSSADLAYIDVAVDSSGQLKTTAAAGGGGAATIADGADVAQGTTTDLSSANTVIGLLKAIKAAVSGTLTTARSWTLSSGTDSVNVGNFPASQAVTGPLTDTQLRATPVPVSGTVTATTGGLTDTQLRASAVPVSMATQTPDVTDRAARLLGHVTVDSAPTTAITAASLPLPTGAALDATILAALGSSTATDAPSAWTALDQLNRIRKAAEAELKAVQALVALQTPKPVAKTTTTLLHRS